MTYTVQQLAAGSYDVLLAAALAREVNCSGVTREWLAELPDETPPAERPAPFMAQRHVFKSRSAALEWLGIQAGEATTKPTG